MQTLILKTKKQDIAVPAISYILGNAPPFVSTSFYSLCHGDLPATFILAPHTAVSALANPSQAAVFHAMKWP